jgi:hypothetical protein
MRKKVRRCNSAKGTRVKHAKRRKYQPMKQAA